MVAPPNPPAALPDPLIELGTLLARTPPDFDEARRLVERIDLATQPALRQQAASILRAAELLSAAGRSPGRIGSLAQGIGTFLGRHWQGALMVLAMLGAAGVTVRQWGGPPSTTRSSPPLLLPPPFPPFLLDSTGRATTFQHGKRDALDVPVKGDKMSLDTDLTKWDRRKWFRAAWLAPYDAYYYVEGGLYFDKEFLYVVARVGDPFPLRNKRKPEASSDGGWDGGALQLRLRADVDPFTKSAKDVPVNLTLWDYAGRGVLHVQSGLDITTTRPVLVVPEPDFDARFQKDQDGTGYTVRSRIAWSRIGFAEAPSGRSSGFCWEVVWADATGERWVGKLTEFFVAKKVKSLAATPSQLDAFPGTWSYRDPGIWGEARFANQP